jgi:hypothetical protein
VIWLAVLLACDGGGSGSGDDGSGDDGSGDDGGGGGDDKVSDISSECTDTGFHATGGMTATVEADGVHVVDDAYPFSCCATFDVSVAVSPTKHWATATYTNVGNKCDCMCRYEVRYTISGLEKGTWTIESPTGETVDVAI